MILKFHLTIYESYIIIAKKKRRFLYLPTVLQQVQENVEVIREGTTGIVEVIILILEFIAVVVQEEEEVQV